MEKWLLGEKLVRNIVFITACEAGDLATSNLEGMGPRLLWKAEDSTRKGDCTDRMAPEGSALFSTRRDGLVSERECDVIGSVLGKVFTTEWSCPKHVFLRDNHSSTWDAFTNYYFDNRERLEIFVLHCCTASSSKSGRVRSENMT